MPPEQASAPHGHLKERNHSGGEERAGPAPRHPLTRILSERGPGRRLVAEFIGDGAAVHYCAGRGSVVCAVWVGVCEKQEIAVGSVGSAAEATCGIDCGTQLR